MFIAEESTPRSIARTSLAFYIRDEFLVAMRARCRNDSVCDSRAGQDAMQDSPVHRRIGESSTSSWRDNMAAAKRGGRKKGGARKSSGRKSSRKSTGRKSTRKGGRKSGRKSR
jgi:hypothetical protein